jgi:hypothetical protein
MVEAAALASAWDKLLDDNVRACVLLHLEPADLARVRAPPSGNSFISLFIYFI